MARARKTAGSLHFTGFRRKKTVFIATAALVAVFGFSSCILEMGEWGSAGYSALPSVEFNSVEESDSNWFYIDLDEEYYRRNSNIALPLYEISTTEEYGDSAQPDRESVSNCEIEYDPDLDFTDNAKKDIYCILDMMEQDLYLHKVALVYNVPKGMCNYTVVRPPWHFNQNFGPGPTRLIKCTINKRTGTDDDGQAECDEREGYFDASSCPEGTEECTSNSPAVSKFPGEKENLQEFCGAYDLTKLKLGNCCFGNYSVYDSNGGDPVEQGKWPGELKNCIGGFARTSWEAYDESGNPIPEIQHAAQDGYRAKKEIGSIYDVTGGLLGFSMPSANYIKSLDVAASRVQSRLNELWEDNKSKGAFRKSAIFPRHPPWPFFSVECKDSGGEVVAALHLSVKEWNTREQFEEFYHSKGGDERADPDVDGREGRNCEYEEDRLSTESECNDFLDLDDDFPEDPDDPDRCGLNFPCIPYK